METLGKHGERSDELAVTQIVTKVANEEGCDPLELPPLYENIDWDELASALESESTVDASFSYCGHDVNVTSGENVAVRID